MSWSLGNGPCEETGSRVKPKSADLLEFIQHQDIHPLVGSDKMTPTRTAQAHQIPTPKTPDQSGQVHTQTAVHLGLEEGQVNRDWGSPFSESTWSKASFWKNPKAFKYWVFLLPLLTVVISSMPFEFLKYSKSYFIQMPPRPLFYVDTTVYLISCSTLGLLRWYGLKLPEADLLLFQPNKYKYGSSSGCEWRLG